MSTTAPKRTITLSGLVLAVAATTGLATGLAFAHVDDEKAKELSQPNPGGIAGGQFDALNVTLAAHLLPGDFGTGAPYASDCWGYTSPAGREYAIIGLRNGTAFVDITVPTEPEIIGAYEYVECIWYDIKVFQHYAYVVNDCQQGMLVFDLSQIDEGTIDLASVDDYPTDSHNVVIDTTSGYLYRTGGGANGLVIYDLNANPAEPEVVGTWSERYVHDAWAHTYTEGPYAGREIVICNGGFNNGWVEPGIDVLDVTDKQNILLLDRYIYPGGEYSHQGCLSADGLYYYMGDEGDEGNGVTTTSLIIDMSDLENLTLLDTFTTGLPAIDHNQYVRGDYIFQANYSTGLRIFDASAPLAPVRGRLLRHRAGTRQPRLRRTLEQLPVLPERHRHRQRLGADSGCGRSTSRRARVRPTRTATARSTSRTSSRSSWTGAVSASVTATSTATSSWTCRISSRSCSAGAPVSSRSRCPDVAHVESGRRHASDVGGRSTLW